MPQPFSFVLRLLTAHARRTLPLALAVLLGLGVTGAVAVPAGAATTSPTGVTAKAASPESLRISWKAVRGAPRYRVAYATSSSMKKATYKRVTKSPLVLTGLKPGQRYYVKVRVIKADGTSLSAYSKAVSARTAKAYAAPSGLRVTSRGASTVALDWKSRGGGLRYAVSFVDSASKSSASASRTFADSKGTVTGLGAGRSYSFRVRVVGTTGRALSPWSKALRASTAKAAPTAASAPLRVATFNVKCANCFAGAPDEGTWYERRAAVVETIKEQHPDVIGVQEASQGWLKDSAGKPVDLSQFEDLRNRLGGSWTLTNDKRNNCVRSSTPNHCTRKDQGASQGTRILFDADRVEKLDSGSQLLPSLDDTSNARYLTWAVLRQRSTGKKFFFADAHLDHSDKLYAMRKQQAQTMAATIRRENPGNLPTFVVGDWNSSRFAKPDNAPYDVLTAAGYSDPLGQTYRSTKTAPGASVGTRINTWMNSFNGFVRTAKGNHGWVNGSYIDYMLMSPGITVGEWENVAHLGAGDQILGTIPSDHNMQRATVWLP